MDKDEGAVAEAAAGKPQDAVQEDPDAVEEVESKPAAADKGQEAERVAESRNMETDKDKKEEESPANPVEKEAGRDD